MTSSNIKSMISGVYYNYYKSLCVDKTTNDKQIVYGYQPSLNQPNLKIMGNDGNNYYYKGTKIYFTNTKHQNIPTIDSNKTKNIIIIEHQALTNSINGVYSKLYVIIAINDDIAKKNDFTTLLESNSNSDVNINSMLIADKETATFFLDSKTNSAVMVFNESINMSVEKLNKIANTGSGNLLFNAPKNTETCTIQLYKSLESWLQCTMVSSNDDKEVAIKSVPINDTTGASKQNATFILIIVIGILIATYTMLPRVYYWLISGDKPKDASKFKDSFTFLGKNENKYILIIGLLLSSLFVVLGLISLGNDTDGLTDNMSSGFLLTGISLFLYVPFCLMIINNFRTNDYQIWLLHKMYNPLENESKKMIA